MKKHTISFFKLLFFSFIYIGVFTKGYSQTHLQLSIVGNDTTETALINTLGYPKTYASIQAMQKAIRQLTLQLQKIGYLNATHSILQKENDSVFSTRFQLHHLFSSVKIVYRPHTLPQKLIASFPHTDSTFTIPIKKTSEILKTLNNHIANQGHPFTHLQLTEFKITSSQLLTARLQLSQTKLRTLDSLIIKGYTQFPRSFLKNYLNLKKGIPFNKNQLDRKVTALKNLPFATTIRPAEVLFTPTQTQVFLYLKKQNSNHFEGFLGFSTNEETHKLQLDGNLSLTLINNLNFGESLTLHYISTSANQRHFEVQAHLPYLFSSPFGLDLSLTLFKQDSTYTTNTQAAQLNYQLNPSTSVAIGYQSTRSNSLQDSLLIANTVNEDYQAHFFTVSAQYTQPNYTSSFFPFKTQLNTTLGIGSRKREARNSPQQYLTFFGQHSFIIDRRNSIYIANTTAILFSKNYLTNELFRFGGMHTVRGFDENSLRASFYSALQTEYRLVLSNNVYIHSIIDYAHFKNALQQHKDNLYGIGFGLGLQTKAGILKIDFANGKTGGQSFKFAHTKVHISLLATF